MRAPHYCSHFSNIIFKIYRIDHLLIAYTYYTQDLHVLGIENKLQNAFRYSIWSFTVFTHTHTHNIVLHFISVSLCRRFGTKCAGCLQGISPSDLVRRARSKVFHLNCFTCMVCNKQLSTGEELYVIDENKFVCKEDYISASAIKEVNLNSGEHDDWSCVYVCVWQRERRFPSVWIGCVNYGSMTWRSFFPESIKFSQNYIETAIHIKWLE